MVDVTKDRLKSHNEKQVRYFEDTLKKTMIPVSNRYLRRHVREVLKFPGFSPASRVLEVGSGMGRYTLILADCDFHLEGLDLSAGLLDRLRAYDGNTHELVLHCEDITRPIPSLENGFDAVIGFFTLHHILDLDGAFGVMAKLVKPGGPVIFVEPNALNPLYYIQILITPKMTWQGDGGFIRMQRGIIFRSMRKAGLVDCRLERFGFFPPFIANRKWGGRIERVLEKFHPWKALLPTQLFYGRRPGPDVAAR